VEFDPDDFLSTVDLTSEHKILDLKDRIEASVIIWNRKVHNKDGKSSWGSAVSQEKREQFEERAQTLLLIIKHRFPGIPQSTLDIAKIQENRVSIWLALCVFLVSLVAKIPCRSCVLTRTHITMFQLLLGRRVRAAGELLQGAGERGVQRHVPDRGSHPGGQPREGEGQEGRAATGGRRRRAP
jgi:hypothetical protein